MGAHTLTALALEEPDRIAGLVIIGPVYLGTPVGEESMAYWDALADGLERAGVDGFIAAYDRNLDPEWRDTLLRIARDRLSLHRHPEAVAQALREVPRSRPFGDLAELEFLDLPALVVASHDDADPGHPYAVAEAWAQRLPQSTLISEEPGSSPLAWQGGRLSREIAGFCERPEVAERLAG
jgi:3-oxoadipate enol-lactonase